jgi:hypothetical protein
MIYLMKQTMFLFNPTINLLQNRHDKITQKFIDGVISYKDYLNYEIKYEKIKNLYIINLN